MAKPHRRLPKPKRAPVRHAVGRSVGQLMRAVEAGRQAASVSPGELERDVLAFIAEHYAGRHLTIETAQLGLSNVAQQLIVAHLKAVACVSS